MIYSPGCLLKEGDFQDVVGAPLLNNQAIWCELFQSKTPNSLKTSKNKISSFFCMNS